MVKIVLIAPYGEFAERFQWVFEEMAKHAAGDEEEKYELDARILYDQDVIKDVHLDCDVIIARAYSATLLSSRANLIPVVSMRIQALDVIRCIKKAWERFGRRKIIFPGTRTMVNEAYQVPELFDVDLEILEIPSTMGDELYRAYERIHDKEAIIIGGKPQCDMAQASGYRYALIESGEEAMALAIEEAKRIAKVARREAEKAQHIRTILDSYDDAVISTDKYGIITYFNSMAEQILQLERERVLGRTIEEAIQNHELRDLFRDRPDCRDELLRYATPGGELVELVANKRSIFLKDARIGRVVTLQYISQVQDSEAKLRSKLSEKENKAKHRFYEILGNAPTLTFAINQAQKFSQVEASVLITGKSGTGKELFAQSMHNASRRKSFPFVAINCAAIPENLLESELFGYVEGAFTGAVRGGKMGLIEMAHRGTLFLDEISELPQSLQARFLRVLQEKEIRRLGHDKVINVDIRVISATNRDLHELVSKGKFREDLYYRLDVLRLNLPTLSQRREDIPTLCRHYIQKYAGQNRKSPPSFSAGAIALLSSLPWEGNIRELLNVCQRLIVLCDDGEISVRLVEEAINRAPQSVSSGDRQFVERLIEEGLSRSEIAARLGIERTTLWRRMKKWGIT